MTCIVQGFKTKKALIQHAEEGLPFTIIDPSIIRPRTFQADQLAEGEQVVVTNHPKRSWYALISRRAGKLRVE